MSLVSGEVAKVVDLEISKRIALEIDTIEYPIQNNLLILLANMVVDKPDLLQSIDFDRIISSRVKSHLSTPFFMKTSLIWLLSNYLKAISRISDCVNISEYVKFLIHSAFSEFNNKLINLEALNGLLSLTTRTEYSNLEELYSLDLTSKLLGRLKFESSISTKILIMKILNNLTIEKQEILEFLIDSNFKCLAQEDLCLYFRLLKSNPDSISQSPKKINRTKIKKLIVGYIELLHMVYIEQESCDNIYLLVHESKIVELILNNFDLLEDQESCNIRISFIIDCFRYGYKKVKRYLIFLPVLEKLVELIRRKSLCLNSCLMGIREFLKYDETYEMIRSHLTMIGFSDLLETTLCELNYDDSKDLIEAILFNDFQQDSSR